MSEFFIGPAQEPEVDEDGNLTGLLAHALEHYKCGVCNGPGYFKGKGVDEYGPHAIFGCKKCEAAKKLLPPARSPKPRNVSGPREKSPSMLEATVSTRAGKYVWTPWNGSGPQKPRHVAAHTFQNI